MLAREEAETFGAGQFDLEGEAHVVVSLLTPPEVLDAALPWMRDG